jgi:hypothetical protein
MALWKVSALIVGFVIRIVVGAEMYIDNFLLR